MNTLYKLTPITILTGVLCCLCSFSISAIASGGPHVSVHPTTGTPANKPVRKSKQPSQTTHILSKLQILRGKPVTILGDLLRPENALEEDAVGKFYTNGDRVLTADQKMAFIWLMSEYAPDNEYHPAIPLSVALSDAKKRLQEPLAHSTHIALKTDLCEKESNDVTVFKHFKNVGGIKSSEGPQACFDEWVKKNAGQKTARLARLASENHIAMPEPAPSFVAPEVELRSQTTLSVSRQSWGWRQVAYTVIASLYVLSAKVVIAEAGMLTDCNHDGSNAFYNGTSCNGTSDSLNCSPIDLQSCIGLNFTCSDMNGTTVMVMGSDCLPDVITTTGNETAFATAGAIYEIASIPVTLFFALTAATLGYR